MKIINEDEDKIWRFLVRWVNWLKVYNLVVSKCKTFPKFLLDAILMDLDEFLLELWLCAVLLLLLWCLLLFLLWFLLHFFIGISLFLTLPLNLLLNCFFLPVVLLPLALLFFSLPILFHHFIAQKGAPPVRLFQLIIINAKLIEQNLIFLPRISIFQNIFHLSIGLTALNHTPKHSVIQVVYMTINLAPSKIVFEAFLVRIYDNPAVEHGDLFQWSGKVLWPVEYVGWAECRHDTTQNLVHTARK